MSAIKKTEDDIESAVPEDSNNIKEMEDNEEIANKNIYADATCELYEVGDQVDARLPECKSWYEGEIKRIVHKPGTSTSDTPTDDGNLLYIVNIHHDEVPTSAWCNAYLLYYHYRYVSRLFLFKCRYY